jgi:hypothetical protein
MQSLDLSGTTPRSENRLKSLFWPSIQTGSDVDYLGSQGYWVCVIVAILSSLTSAVTGHPIPGVFLLLYFYVGGVGVRQHSLYAAAAVFVMYLLNTVVSPGIVSVFVCAVLLSNLRATWIVSFWEAKTVEAEMPIRLSETWGDKFVDKLPPWLWPKVRIAYYIFSAGFLALTSMALVILFGQRHGMLPVRLVR